MYGLFYYGIAERHSIEKLREMVKYGSSLDIFDFYHENSPYLPDYERPTNVASPELNSGSTPSQEDVEGVTGEEGGPAANKVEREEREPVGNKDAAELGINQYGTNSDLVENEEVDVRVEGFEISDRFNAFDASNLRQQAMDAAKEAAKKYYEARANTIDLSDLEDSYDDLANMVPEDTVTSGAEVQIQSASPFDPICPVKVEKKSGFYTEREETRKQELQEKEEIKKQELKEKEDMQKKIERLERLLALKENPSLQEKDKSEDRVVSNPPQSGVQDAAILTDVSEHPTVEDLTQCYPRDKDISASQLPLPSTEYLRTEDISST